MYRKTIISLIFIILALESSAHLNGQNRIPELSGTFNPITTGVPFLASHVGPSINGEITSVPDGTLGSGIYGNPGLLALEKSKFGATADYSLWPEPLLPLPDMYLFGFGAFYRLNKRHTVGINLRSHSDGDIDMIDMIHHASYTIHPLNFATTISYTWNISVLTGIGAGFRYVQSGGLYEKDDGSHEHRNGHAIAADLGFAKQFPGRNGRVDQFFGISLHNAGSKMKRQSDQTILFIPTTLKAGYGVRANISGWHSLSLSYELSKLLVPTPPAYDYDSLDINFNPTIKAGYDPNVGVFRGMMQSFYDAPGGFREELHEIAHSIAMVYHYRFLSAGAGYHFEHPTKGNARLWSFGLSGNFKIGRAGITRVQANLSYVMPVSMQNPFDRIIRFGLSLYLGKEGV